jgi:thioredoxin-like negative regulator of GroEL
MKVLTTAQEFQDFKDSKSAVLFYFSTRNCNVCKVLKPKLIEFINENFPQISMAYIDVEMVQDLSAQLNIFSVPTILVYIEGKEFFRKSRNFSLAELYNELERPYSLYF